jgi:hypothetical protein
MHTVTAFKIWVLACALARSIQVFLFVFDFPEFPYAFPRWSRGNESINAHPGEETIAFTPTLAQGR